MGLREVFAPLLRALAGRRPPAPSFPPLGWRWDELQAQVGLPAGAFHDVLARGSLHPHFHYRPFTKPKKGGGRRQIVEPDVRLKRVQSELLRRYLTSEPHPAATAYRKGMSIADHVWPHAGAEALITADIQDFFPSTREDRVESWWGQRVEFHEARLLTLLTTYRGELPQGAPTSPALSNLVNREMDARLARRAEAVGARYTRYCDDMVFSWRDAPGPPSDFHTAVRATLLEFGYRLHPRKGWQVHQRRDEPEITGLILTRRGRVRLPDEVRRVMRRLARSRDPRDAERLAGYRAYQTMVVGRRAGRTPPREQPERRSVRWAAPGPRAASEGDSDEIPF